ncbi:ParA family protein [Halomonas faecis]|uniref:ParA family protein n=1 Tax=Halomonas faecis TaxID=1562110 RepID=UPI0013D5A544|nr:ParA family protein [Halomonas faecis]
MTKIISFANQKGGVGKSTICLQTVFYLQEAGYRVLAIDLDPQGNTSSRLSQGDEGTYSGTPSVRLFDEGLKEIQPMRCERGMDLIWTMKNDPELSEIESLPLDCVRHPIANLRASGILEHYDYVLIDCPPSLGRKLVAALTMSTHVICPVQVSGFALDGVEGLLNTIISVQEELNPGLDNTGMVINNLKRGFEEDMNTRDQLRKAVPDLVYEAEVGVRGQLDVANLNGVPVWSIKKTSAREAAKEIRAVIEELMRKVG